MKPDQLFSWVHTGDSEGVGVGTRNEKNKQSKAGVRKAVRADNSSQQVHQMGRQKTNQSSFRELQGTLIPLLQGTFWYSSKVFHISKSVIFDHSFT